VWDQQILLLWILLPPVFLICGFMALAAPFIVREKDRSRSDREGFIPDRAGLADRKH
jgi:hypothetical protein